MKPPKHKNFVNLSLLFIAIFTPWIIGGIYLNRPTGIEGELPLQLINYKVDTSARVDHSKFEILQKKFITPQEVTQACTSCHNQTGQEVMRSSHWKWSRDVITNNGDTISIGKKNLINNFCIAVNSNEARCTSCHIGYGWVDDTFDFDDPSNIDCIVCHDNTGTYKKFPPGGGYPVSEAKVFDNTLYEPPDYNYIAQNVSSPSTENCGVCHFVGGGGDNVKHGDIAFDITEVTRDIDVHMGKGGEEMDCVACHISDHHNIKGKLYSVSSNDEDRALCEQCHTEQPHKNKTLDNHTKKIACQTCHIPEYAKVSATKMYWDWSTAGQFNEDGSLKVIKDSIGNITYFTKKGSFIWEKNVIPEYVWFNGHADHYQLGQVVDDKNIIQLNTLKGDYSDPKAKIIPVKVHRGKQIYDPINQILILPHLYGSDSSSFWKNYDWDKAASWGMKEADLPYSGEYAFAETEMYWPINHMVADKEEALVCADCHNRNGRLANLNDFYLAGRDRSITLDRIGFLLIILSFIGVSIHASLRIVKIRNNKSN